MSSTKEKNKYTKLKPKLSMTKASETTFNHEDINPNVPP